MVRPVPTARKLRAHLHGNAAEIRCTDICCRQISMKAFAQAALEAPERILGPHPEIREQESKRTIPMQGTRNGIMFTCLQLATQPARMQTRRALRHKGLPRRLCAPPVVWAVITLKSSVPPGKSHQSRSMNETLIPKHRNAQTLEYAPCHYPSLRRHASRRSALLRLVIERAGTPATT